MSLDASPRAGVNPPLVSILTPVYNGGPYLVQCIESVLAQTYTHWEYVIVDNCSTDDTPEIARRYAALDPRIRVVTNTVFVNADENHNIAFRLISPESRYCKVVQADDWVQPDCVQRMVAVALAHPSVGLVVCHQQSGDRVLWTDMPANVEFATGREAARMLLLEGRCIFGPPTACLYRSDLVRKRPSFFPHIRPHADISVCYEILKEADFGFVHAVLAEERLHPGQESAKLSGLMANDLAYLEDVVTYGPVFLTPAELEARERELFELHYRLLGRNAFRMKGRRFWAYQESRLAEIGRPMNWYALVASVARTVRDGIKDPATAMRKVLHIRR